jgi:tetratricopeptide (TPR) repeat protein
MRRPLAALAGLLVVGPPVLAAQKANPPTIAELEATAARDSLDPSAHYRLSIGYWRAKRYDDEARALRRAIAIDPRYAPAYLSLAFQVYDRRPKLWEEERKNKVPAAWVDSLERSYRLRRQAFLIDPLVDFRVVGTEAPPEDMVVLPDYGDYTTWWVGEIALGAFGSARYELSYAAWQRFVQRAFSGKPRDSLPSFIFWYRGLAAAHRNIHQVAIADFQTLLARALAQEQSDSLIQIPLETNDYRFILALLHERAQRPVDAVALYKEALAGDLGLFMAHVHLAQVYRRYRQWNDAVAEARRAVETNPDDPTALRELGEVLSEAGRPAEAEEPLRLARERNPLDVWTLLALGALYQATSRPQEAREAYGRFLELAPAARVADRVIADTRERLAMLPAGP